MSENENKLGRFRVSLDLLKQALEMPESARIVNIIFDPMGVTATFVVLDSGLEAVPDGHVIPEYLPVVTRTYHDVCGHETFTWSWGDLFEVPSPDESISFS